MMIIGFFLFGIVGAAIGLILGLTMGEVYYNRQKQEEESKS